MKMMSNPNSQSRRRLSRNTKNRPKQKDGAVPTVLPGCSRYNSSHTASKCTRLSLENKDDEPLYQAVRLSLELEVEDNENFKIRDAQDPLFLVPAGSGSCRISNLRVRPEPDLTGSGSALNGNKAIKRNGDRNTWIDALIVIELTGICIN